MTYQNPTRWAILIASIIFGVVGYVAGSRQLEPSNQVFAGNSGVAAPAKVLALYLHLHVGPSVPGGQNEAMLATQFGEQSPWRQTQ